MNIFRRTIEMENAAFILPNGDFKDLRPYLTAAKTHGGQFFKNPQLRANSVTPEITSCGRKAAKNKKNSEQCILNPQDSSKPKRKFFRSPNARTLSTENLATSSSI